MSRGEGTYSCKLDDATLAKAKSELNEDPKQRAGQIEDLRQWVKKQPHINSRTDDEFLLSFLRWSKFSQVRAQQVLDNFWTTRTTEKEWFASMDPADPKLQAILDLGQQFPLGKNDEGQMIIYIRTGGYDPKYQSFGDIMKLGFMQSDVLLQDEANQVHGFQILLDFSEFGTPHMFAWDRATIQKSMKCWQDVYPTRNKGIHYYNTPMIFNALSEIFSLFMKEKTKKRLHFHKDSKESLAKQIPKRILPNHLGGEAGTIEELAKKWKETMLKHREDFLYNSQFGVDESKRPKPEAKDDGGWGIVGSFRKLTTD